MGHEESFYRSSAGGRGTRFVQGLPVSTGHHLLRRLVLLLFPLNLGVVEALLAARGIELAYETARCWATTFGLSIAKRILSSAPGRGDE
ncbi:hypothetical protein [Burkholderia sp. LMG 32019]|uniref:hypothetical protein n=1 Tax=Burkholderia sp. LMG 32019 TaxID=3158173 RepID=UPI003C2E686C